MSYHLAKECMTLKTQLEFQYKVEELLNITEGLGEMLGIAEHNFLILPNAPSFLD